MSLPRLIALDVGSSHLAGGVFEAGENRQLLLRRFAFVRLEPAAAGDLRGSEQPAAFLREFASREKKGTAVAIAVPAHLTLLKFGKTPSLGRTKQAEAVRFEASQLIPGPLAEAVWDHVVLADDGTELEFMLAAAKLAPVQSLCAAATAARLHVQQLAPATLALHAGFRLNHPQATAGAIVADVGARSTSCLFLDGACFTARSLPLGGDHLTQAVASALRLEFGPAETLKLSILSGRSSLSETSVEHGAVHTAKDDFIRRLRLELIRSSMHHRRRTGAAPPEILYLTGGGALLPNLAATLSEQTNLRVERYDPLRRVAVGGDASLETESVRAALAALVGLAAPLVSGEKLGINLLPPPLPTEQPARLRQRFLIAAAVGGLLAPWPAAGYFHYRAVRAHDEAAQLEAQAAPLRALQVQHAAQRAKIDELRGQIAALERIVGLKSSWANFLDDLQTRLGQVGDVWLDRLALIPAAADQSRVGSDARLPDGASATPVRVLLSGRLLDVAQPLSKVSPEATNRAKRLVASFADSAFVSAVEHERFDSTQAGLLRFDVTLVIGARPPL